MAEREELQLMLENTFVDNGKWLWGNPPKTDDILKAIADEAHKHVKFQPKASYRLSYPVIVYSLDGMYKRYASNGTYRLVPRYQVTVIDKDPDSGIPYKVALLTMCEMNRRYVADNLYHTVFTIYH